MWKIFYLVAMLFIIREVTQEKGLMSALNVGNLSPVAVASVTREFILVKGFKRELNVGNYLAIKLCLLRLNSSHY